MKLQCEALFILDAQNLYAKLQKQNAKEILYKIQIILLKANFFIKVCFTSLTYIHDYPE